MARKKADPFEKMGVESAKPGTKRVTYGDHEEETEKAAVQNTETAENEESKPAVRGRGRPKKPTTQPNGLQPGEERITVVMEKALGDNLRDYAYTERMTLREAMELAVSSFLKSEMERGVEILKRK